LDGACAGEQTWGALPCFGSRLFSGATSERSSCGVRTLHTFALRGSLVRQCDDVEPIYGALQLLR
jgi:hypothetical protein